MPNQELGLHWIYSVAPYGNHIVLVSPSNNQRGRILGLLKIQTPKIWCSALGLPYVRNSCKKTHGFDSHIVLYFFSQSRHYPFQLQLITQSLILKISVSFWNVVKIGTVMF